MEAAVATCSVGDVPESVGSGCILQRTTAQSIRIPIRILRPVTSLCRIGILPRPVSVGKDVGVQPVLQITVFFFLHVLRFQVFIRNGIQQARTVNADGGFETDFVCTYIIPLVGYINGTLGNRYFRIAQRIGLTVGELVPVLVGIFMPGQHNLAFVQRSLERGYGMGLRHTCKPRNVGIGCRVVYN
ncbi:unknown [Bacteroides sp. CAG:702]|nr:unknown [Bacteroides sp. CAG:702]